MTECARRELQGMLPDLLHGRLDGGTREMLQAHVAACPACAAELALLVRARKAGSRVPVLDVDRVARAVVEGTVTGRLDVTHGVMGRARRSPWWIGVAAASLLAAAVGVTLSMQRDAGRVTELSLDAHLTMASDAELEAALASLDTLEATFASEPEVVLTYEPHGGE